MLDLEDKAGLRAARSAAIWRKLLKGTGRAKIRAAHRPRLRVYRLAGGHRLAADRSE